MKKIIVIAFAFSLISTSAFAANTFTSDGASTAVEGVLAGFKTSKLVAVTCNSVLQSYAATSDHVNGTRIFGVASGDPLLYYKDKTDTELASGSNVTGANADTDSATVSTWSKL